MYSHDKESKKKYTSRDKYKLRDKISNLQEEECCEILKIIKNSTDKITKNNYGFHINFKYLSDETIDKISFFLEFRNASNNEIKTIEKLQKKTLDLHKEYNQFDINNDFMSGIPNSSNISNIALDEVIEKEFENNSEASILSDSDSEHNDDVDDTIIVNNKLKKYKKNEEIEEFVLPIISNDKKKKKGFRNKMLRKCKDINRNNEPNYFNAVIYNDLEDAASIDDVDNTYSELIEDKW